MKIIEVAAGLVFRDGKLLITQRPEGGHLAGFWEFPGGKREPHESFEQALHRELMEELGIEVEVRELVESVIHTYAERTVRIEFFRCRWKCHEPQTLGCPAFRWVSRHALKDHRFPAADARLLDKLATDKTFWGQV